MKKNLIFCVSIAVFFFSLSLPRLKAEPSISFPDTEPEISMDFQDASLKDVLKVLSIQSGLNFIAAEGLQDRKITLYLDKVPLKQAMDKLFKANNLSYDLYKDANIFIVKDLGAPQVETITKVFYLQYATVSSSSLKQEMSSQIQSESEFSTGSGSTGSSGGASSGGSGKWASEDDTGITKAVRKLLSKAGSVVEDFRTNSLIITDTPMQLSVISKVIASLDVPIPQVLLEVEMLDVSKNTVDKLGVNWPTTIASLNVAGNRNTKFPFFGDKAAQGIADTHFAPSVLTLIGANLTLDFLRAQTDTKFLARPKLLTLNNETAEIRIATNESIGVSSTSVGTTATTTATPERAETGVILRVTPQVNEDRGEITMFIYPRVAEAVQGNAFTSSGQTFQFRDPEERSTKSMVRIKDGETVVLGGLIRADVQKQETKVPILGDIPLIGALFRHTGGSDSNPDKNKERELLVFITPHIIKDKNINTNVNTNIEIAKTQNNTPFQREQDTKSAINQRDSISSALSDFEKGR